MVIENKNTIKIQWLSKSYYLYHEFNKLSYVSKIGKGLLEYSLTMRIVFANVDQTLTQTATEIYHINSFYTK